MPGPLVGLAAKLAIRKAAKKAIQKGIKRKATAQKAAKAKGQKINTIDYNPTMKRNVDVLKEHGVKSKYIKKEGKKPTLRAEEVFYDRKTGKTTKKYKILVSNPSMTKIKNFLGY